MVISSIVGMPHGFHMEGMQSPQGSPSGEPSNDLLSAEKLGGDFGS